jgi:Spy/CpxP family protein refolding chaperone
VLSAFEQKGFEALREEWLSYHAYHQQAVRMQKVVALTPEQATKVEEIFFQRATAVEAVNNNAALSPEQKAAEVAKIKREKEVELQAVLTPEQYQKYKEMREERKKGK